MLQINKASLCMQSCQDFEQLLMIDGQGGGWKHAAEMLADLAQDAAGDYVLILDDDDILLNADGVRLMKEAAQSQPAAVIFKGWHADLGILPNDNTWMRRPRLAQIGSFDFITRREVFCELVDTAVTNGYNNDFGIIDGVFERCLPVTWLNVLMCAAMRRSRGK
jgi:GT2 family glycosyltransferase